MSKVHFGGMPTEIDVRAITEAFPDLREGTEIMHDEIVRVIRVEHGSNRYRAVTEAWRRQMLNQHNVEIAAVPGSGFRVLPPDERISGSIKGFQIGMRKQLRAVKRSGMVRTDDEGLRRKQDLLRRYGAAIASEASNMMKEIEPPKPQQQMPRLVPRATA